MTFFMHETYGYENSDKGRLFGQVENMNSVMDDNRLLTLPNGERIKLQPFASMLFEVGDLQYASPATVSRCGMVWVDPKNLGYRPYFETWLLKYAEQAPKLQSLFDKYVDQLIDWVLEGLLEGEYEPRPKSVIPITNLNMVTALCFTLDALLKTSGESISDGRQMEAIFIAALTWSVGATLLEPDRKRFDTILKKLSGLNGSDNPTVNISSVPGATKSTAFDYMYSQEQSSWISWTSQVKEYTPAPGIAFHKLLVPTADTIRSTWLVDTCFHVGRPSIFVGDSGTAKTVTLQHYLNILSEKNNLLNVSFSSRTSGRDLQINIESNIEKRTKGTFGMYSITFLHT